MRSAILGLLQTGQTFEALRAALDGALVGQRQLCAGVDTRARPYLDHTVSGWTDGPPGSTVVAVVAGRDPAADKWRRFTITKVGPWRYEIDAFPTPFNNPEAPLAPGIPPGASRRFS